MFFKLEKRDRLSFKNSEKNQLLYKQLYKNSSYNIKRKISFKFFEKKKNIYFSQIVNRCLLTNRSKGLVSRKLKMARYPFRIKALLGAIPGLHISTR
jgi:ribosomal protein S14